MQRRWVPDITSRFRDDERRQQSSEVVHCYHAPQPEGREVAWRLI